MHVRVVFRSSKMLLRMTMMMTMMILITTTVLQGCFIFVIKINRFNK